MNKRYIRLSIVLVLFALVLGLAAADTPALAQEGDFQLTVLHTNDVHARFAEFNAFGSICDEEEAAAGECFGGAARIKTAVDSVRAETDNVLLLDGGDQFQGTLFYTQYRGQAAQQLMNAIGYDAFGIGNHEFDDGPATLADFIEGANFRIVNSNIDVSNEPALADLVEPHVVLEVGGGQIGLVGYTTEETEVLSSPGPNVVFNEIEPAVQAAVNELQEMGVNKIVALSHAGFGRDQEVAAAVSGIDVIIAGHTNTFLSNSDEDAEGPYPTVVDSPEDAPVLIVSAGEWGRHLGRLDVTFDDAGVPTGWQGDTMLLDAGIEQDPDLLAEVQALQEPLQELRNEVIGSAAVDLDGDRSVCRFEECTMGNLVTDAIMSATASQGVDIAVMNGGGIRASIPAGEISRGQVLEVLPFGNTIATFDLTGSGVMAMLENSVSRAEDPENDGTGRFLQVAGLRYTWNPDQPVGSRIVSAEVRNDDGSYSPVDPNATYTIAANDFLSGGGDGYDVFAEEATNKYDAGNPLDVVVADYISEHSPVAPELEGRIAVSDEAPETLPETGGVSLLFEFMLIAAGAAATGAGAWLRRTRE